MHRLNMPTLYLETSSASSLEFFARNLLVLLALSWFLPIQLIPTQVFHIPFAQWSHRNTPLSMCFAPRWPADHWDQSHHRWLSDWCKVVRWVPILATGTPIYYELYNLIWFSCGRVHHHFHRFPRRRRKWGQISSSWWAACVVVKLFGFACLGL